MSRKSATADTRETRARCRSGRLSVEDRLNRANEATVMICAAALTDVEQLEVGAIGVEDLLATIGTYAQHVAEELYWLRKMKVEILNTTAPDLVEDEMKAARDE